MTTELTAARNALMARLQAAVGTSLTPEAFAEFFADYDNELIDARENEVAEDQPGQNEIDQFVTAANALNNVDHDHLRRRVHKALGVLMLEPQPSELQKIGEAIGEGLQQIAPMLAQMAGQGAGQVVETPAQADHWVVLMGPDGPYAQSPDGQTRTPLKDILANYEAHKSAE